MPGWVGAVLCGALAFTLLFRDQLRPIRIIRIPKFIVVIREVKVAVQVSQATYNQIQSLRDGAEAIRVQAVDTIAAWETARDQQAELRDEYDAVLADLEVV